MWYYIVGIYHHGLTYHLPGVSRSEFGECMSLPSDVQSFHTTDAVLMVVIFVIYCNVINYHRFSSLEHHAFIIAQFLWARS